MGKKKQIVKALAAAVLFAALGACLVGCGSTKPYNEAFVVANVAGAAIDVSAVAGEVEDAVDRNAYVSIIRADGKPSEISGAGVVGSKANTAARRNPENSEWIESISQALASVKAENPELDLVAALDCARKSLNSSGAYENSDNVIAVVSSGFDTSGPASMLSGELFCDPADVVGFYEDEWVDLSGCDIRWYCLGETAEPQQEPTNSVKSTLMRFWEAVLIDGCNAKSVEFIDVNATQHDSSGDLPSVTCIALPSLAKMTSITAGSTATLGTAVLNFEPGSPDFSDAEAAKEVLRPYAEALAANKDLSVRVVGSTASDLDLDYLKRLSLQRAESTSKLLQELGASASQISVEGTGNWGEDHIYDWANEAENRLEPIAAAANRHITLEFC